jgi:hypothetical protein
MAELWTVEQDARIERAAIDCTRALAPHKPVGGETPALRLPLPRVGDDTNVHVGRFSIAARSATTRSWDGLTPSRSPSLGSPA